MSVLVWRSFATLQMTASDPMDLPVGPDYVIGPGDGLEIDLWGGVSQRCSASSIVKGVCRCPKPDRF